MESLCGHYHPPAPLCFRKLRCLATPENVLACPGTRESRERHGIRFPSRSGLCAFPGLAPWIRDLLGLSAGPAWSSTDTSEKETLPSATHPLCEHVRRQSSEENAPRLPSSDRICSADDASSRPPPSPSSPWLRVVLVLVNDKPFSFFRARLQRPRIPLNRSLADSRRELAGDVSYLSPGTQR